MKQTIALQTPGRSDLDQSSLFSFDQFTAARPTAPVIHRDARFLLVRSGSGVIRLQGREYPLSAGSLAAILPWQISEIVRVDEPLACSVIAYHYDTVARAAHLFRGEDGQPMPMARLMEKYDFADPVLFSVVLGHEGEAPATPQALAAMIQMIPSNAIWGITQAHRKDFSLLAGALGMGARTVRIGFEDSNYLDPQTQVTSNAPLVEKTVKLLRAMDKEPMLPDEARELFRIGR